MLDLRRQQQVQAQLRQLQIRMELEGLQQQVRALEDELESAARKQIESFGHSAGRDAATPPALSADRLMAMTHFSDRLCDQIQDVGGKRQHVEIALQQAAVELARISTAVEGLEALLQTQRKEHLKQSDRRWQQDVDEVVLRRWQNRRGPQVEEQSHV